MFTHTNYKIKMATESDYNSYKALKAQKLQECLFCEQVFNNRYSSIVHNSSHIIIPLLKHQVHYCEICSVYFTSTEAFNTHLCDNQSLEINDYNDDNNFDNKVPEIKLEKLPRLNNGNKLVKGENFEENNYDSTSEDESLHNIAKREIETKDDFKNDEEHADFLTSNLKFEVDHEYKLTEDFTSDCEVNIQYTWSNNKDTETNYNNKKSITSNIVYEEPIDVFELHNVLRPDVPVTSGEYKSVHYTDLMSSRIFKCKYCSVSFPNRFSLITHETTHLRIVRRCNRYLLCPQCDRYIVGNYRTVQKHEAVVHGIVSINKSELRTCDICGLRYRKYSRHVRNYHPNELESHKGLDKLVDNGEGSVQNTNWIERSYNNNVCDLCYSFLKSSIKKKYLLMGTANFTTERPCHECKNLFLQLKTVKTVTRIHKTRQINRGSCRRYTNEMRLKNIQIRLKMINKLSKFYEDLLLIFKTNTSSNKVI